MAEFTKGPWTWHTGLDGRVYLGGRHSALVLAVRADSIYVSQEDSRLIAAAPELYEIAELYVAKAWSIEGYTKALEVLAKARGEK